MMENKNNNCDVGIEIELKSPESFLLIKETLTRIGIPSSKSKTLFQTAHILHKSGRYYLVHFKELFALDRKETDISDDDYRRRNTISKLLDQWKLCRVLNREQLEFTIPVEEIKIVPHKEKKDWTLIAKYTLGSRKVQPKNL